MKTPIPLSDDWLYWNPETIHRYPHLSDPKELYGASIIAEKTNLEDAPSTDLAKSLVHGLLRDITAGLVSGLVTAILLALLIVFFPNSTRAQEPPSADRPAAPAASLSRP